MPMVMLIMRLMDKWMIMTLTMHMMMTLMMSKREPTRATMMRVRTMMMMRRVMTLMISMMMAQMMIRMVMTSDEHDYDADDGGIDADEAADNVVNDDE